MAFPSSRPSPAQPALSALAFSLLPSPSEPRPSSLLALSPHPTPSPGSPTAEAQVWTSLVPWARGLPVGGRPTLCLSLCPSPARPLLTQPQESSRGLPALGWGWGDSLPAPLASSPGTEPVWGNHAVPTDASGCCPTAVLGPSAEEPWHLAGTHLGSNHLPVSPQGTSFT